jgi:hypothetical protein
VLAHCHGFTFSQTDTFGSLHHSER